MQFKLSHVGYSVCGIGLSMFIGFLSVASPVSQFVVWIIGMICILDLAVGFFNFAGLVVKGFGFNRKTFTYRQRLARLLELCHQIHRRT